MRMRAGLIFLMIVLSGVAVSIAGSATTRDEGGKVSEYRSRPMFRAAAVTPDADETLGKLWQDSPVLELKAFVGPQDPDHRTVAQVGWTEQGICVVFWCFVRGSVRGTGTMARDEAPWQYDAFEIMLAPGADDPAKYYHIVITPGCVLQPEGDEPPAENQPYDSYGHDPAWDGEGLCIVTCPLEEKKGWKGLVLVPFRDLKLDRDTAPEKWRLNLARLVPPVSDRASLDLGWSVPEGSAPHDGSSFGYFSIPEAAKKVETEE